MQRAALVLATILSTAACESRPSSADRQAISDSVTIDTPADSLLAAGEAFHTAGKFDSAHAVLSRALTAARSLADTRAEALVLTRLGLASWRLGNLSAATAEQESALALKRRLGMTAELSRSLNALGLIALSENRNAEAARLFEEAISAARAADDPAGIARATGNAGNAYSYLGDLIRARGRHREMRAAGRALDDSRMEANGLANEAMIDIAEGDPVSAVARLDTARALYAASSYSLGEQNALGQLATALEAQGEYGRAFAVLDTALALARAASAREQEIEIQRLLGGLHSRIGDYRRAIRYYQLAESISRTAGIEADAGSVLRGAAEAYLAIGDVQAARSKAVGALDIHTDKDEPLEQLDDRLLLANLDIRAGRVSEAAEQLRRADLLARQIGTRGARTRLAIATGRWREVQRDWPGVISALSGIDPVTREFDFEAGWLAASLTGRAYGQLGLTDSAVKYGREAVESMERVRGDLALEPIRATFAAERASVYGDAVLALLRAGRTSEAFSISDRARSRGLFEHLAAVRAGTNKDFHDLAQSEELLRRIDALVAALRNTRTPSPGVRSAADDERIQSQLVAARADYEALVLRSSAARRVGATERGGQTTALTDVAEALTADEALVQYFVLADRIVLFLVRPATLLAEEVFADEHEVAERVRLLRDLWGRPRNDWQVANPASEALHAQLISPLLERGHLRGVRRLVIVPHGRLAQVPFTALRDAKQRRLLGERFGVAYAPSAAAFVALRRRNETGPAETKAWGFAPLGQELPATVAEVKAFGRTLPGARTVTGQRATERVVRRALSDDGIVHVATHGNLNRRHPMFSRIDLARPRNPRPDDDGRLEVRELLGMRVRSSLVFLSGCETGAGEAWLPEPVRGSGELTLSQAFLMSGARNVISTLWRIEDAGASVFAGRFYRHLKTLPAAEALSRTQRDLMMDPRYASPYYWAGYVLSGDGQVSSRRARNSIASVR